MTNDLERLINALWGFIFYIQPDSELAERAREQDLELLAHAQNLDVRAVGKLLGAGLQHRIYEYHENELPMVLKLATPIPGLRFPSAKEAEENIELIARCFEPYAIQPTQVVHLDNFLYAIKQRRLQNFHSIIANDLSDEKIRIQFLDIVRRNQDMLRQFGRSLDFLGREGQRKARAALVGLPETPTIANLVIENGTAGLSHLRIIDTDLENFHSDASTPRDLQSRIAAQLAVEINRLIIQHFFAIDIRLASAL